MQLVFQRAKIFNTALYSAKLISADEEGMEKGGRCFFFKKSKVYINIKFKLL